MKIIFAGGGTGGHLFCGFALAEAFLKRKSADHPIEILFVGTAYGIEKEMVPKEGYRLEFIPIKQLKGKGVFHRLKTLLQVPEACLKSYSLLKKEKPDLVFGIGGYASGPIVLMAKILGIKTAINEQNSVPGLTNRILSKFSDLIFIAFENAKGFFPKKKTFLTGNPIRKKFFENILPLSTPLLPGERMNCFNILILGGSQGAHSINETMMEVANLLYPIQEKFCFIHQTGKSDAIKVREAYHKIGFQAEVLEFIHEIQNYYLKADLVISRSGAGTINELEILGKPSLLIPYPYAADDHQKMNALELAQKGAARMILPEELNAEKLAFQICDLMDHPEELQKIGKNAKSLAKPEAAEEIVERCVAILKRKNPQSL